MNDSATYMISAKSSTLNITDSISDSNLLFTVPLFRYHDLEIDFERNIVWLAGKVIYLSLTEYRLLAYLAHHSGKMIPTRSLLFEIWGRYPEIDETIVRVNISRLRNKLNGDSNHQKYITSSPGKGYMIPSPLADTFASPNNA